MIHRAYQLSSTPTAFSSECVLLPSFVWEPGCFAGGREFDSSRTNTQDLKIIEEKVLPFNSTRKWLDFQVFSDKDYKP